MFPLTAAGLEAGIKELKNKYGKYLMGMLVVTALVEELRVTPGKISIVVSTVIPLPKSSTKTAFRKHL